jgi:hypothetical protein
MSAIFSDIENIICFIDDIASATFDLKQLIHVLTSTMIDLSTDLIELIVVPDKENYTVACAFNHSWLCHYPRPLICLHDKGTEFTGIEFQEHLQSYGSKVVIASTANPQTNAILECMHASSNCKPTLIPSLDVYQTQFIGQPPT